jgi:hypothetical protein
VLGAMFAISTRVAIPAVLSGPKQRPARHPAEWLTPLVLVAVTIAAFLVVEATNLFGGAEVVSTSDSMSHADRAHQGFGQLSVVTLIVLVLLAWSGRAASAGPPRHRRLMAMVGGSLLVIALLLAASALRRLTLYMEAYGWTVPRLNAGAFEIWVVTVLVGVALGWLLHRTDLLPRFVIGSAGLGLLVLAMAGPDALVATANVDRFEKTKGQIGVENTKGQIDWEYLSGLSSDAVPALERLPEPQRSCTLLGRVPDDDPWQSWNLSRSRADELLRSKPPGECTLPPSRS